MERPSLLLRYQIDFHSSFWIRFLIHFKELSFIFSLCLIASTIECLLRIEKRRRNRIKWKNQFYIQLIIVRQYVLLK